jgi:hypothetical protein
MTDNPLKGMRGQPPAADRLAPLADRLDATMLQAAQELAAVSDAPLPVAYQRLAAELVRRLRERTPANIMETDGRAAHWRVRVRLYDMAHPDDVQADSDPDLAADKPGETIIAGLPAVAEHLAILATRFHGSAIAGLDEATLRHKLKSLRPTLSRNNGAARWRVAYKTATGAWVAVVNVEREN